MTSGLIERSVLQDIFDRSGSESTIWRNDNNSGFYTNDGGYVAYTSNNISFNTSLGSRITLSEVTVTLDNQQSYQNAANQTVNNIYRTRNFLRRASTYNTVASGTFLVGELANTSWSTQIFKYAKRVGGKVRSPQLLTRANRLRGLRVASTFSKLGVVTEVIGTGISYYNIYSDYDKNGNGIHDVSNWDISDAAVGTVATTTSVLVIVGVVSNPVGWIVGIGAGLYFGYRLISDLSKN